MPDVRGEGNLPVRIYTLAKELKLDSKVLVDICTKAGILGKGSALASLTDEELVQLKAFMAKGGGAASAKPAATTTAKTGVPVGAAAEGGTFRREDYVAPAGNVGK